MISALYLIPIGILVFGILGVVYCFAYCAGMKYCCKLWAPQESYESIYGKD